MESTVERMATWKGVPDTYYVATTCTEGALPGVDSISSVSSPQSTDTEVLQMNWEESVVSFEN